MGRKPKPPAPTIHHLDVAASLQAQSNAVMALIQVVQNTLALAATLEPTLRDQLEEKANAAQDAMWPATIDR